MAYTVKLDEEHGMVYGGDVVVLSGYIKNYTKSGSDPVIEFDTNGAAGVMPSILSVVRGDATVTLGAHEHATVTGLPESGIKNADEISLTVEAESGYKIDHVKVNGADLAAEEGVYKFVAYETMEITVETSEEGAAVLKEAYKLDGTDATQGSNGYATVSEITCGGVKWDVVANTTINPWRFGGKNIENTDRAATAKAAVSTEDIVKVVAVCPGKTATWNSITLKV